VIERSDEVCLERHGIAGHAEIEGLGGLVAEMGGGDRPLEKLMRRHVVLDEEAEVDNALCHVFAPLKLPFDVFLPKPYRPIEGTGD
jgi:hypothetical protein